MGDLSPNLSRSEFKCHCSYPECTRTPVDIALPPALQDCVDHFAFEWHGRSQMFQRIAIHINSGHRCFKHNKDIGSRSDVHPNGLAADFWMEAVFSDGNRERIPDEKIADYLELRYPNEYGIGRYPRSAGGWTHLDVRENGPARWTA